MTNRPYFFFDSWGNPWITWFSDDSRSEAFGPERFARKAELSELPFEVEDDETAHTACYRAGLLVDTQEWHFCAHSLNHAVVERCFETVAAWLRDSLNDRFCSESRPIESALLSEAIPCQGGMPRDTSPFVNATMVEIVERKLMVLVPHMSACALQYNEGVVAEDSRTTEDIILWSSVREILAKGQWDDVAPRVDWKDSTK